MMQWNSLALESGAAIAPVLTPAPAPLLVPLLPSGTVLGWNRVALQAIGSAQTAPPQAARMLALVHTGMYNAWAACDDDARQTPDGKAVRLPRAQRHAAARASAMSHAAHDLLLAQCPAQAPLFEMHMQALGLDPAAPATQFSPAGIGRTQAAALLESCVGNIAGGVCGNAPVDVWYGLAARVSARDRHDDDEDVLLFFVLGNALAQGGAAAAADVLRRFTGSDRLGAGTFSAALGPGSDQAAGRQAGARVFERARKCWMGRR
jgi:hypothetical protein